MAVPNGTVVAIELDEDELLGAHLLATMEGVGGDDADGFAEVLSFTLQRGIAHRITAAGMSWPPTAASFDLAESIGREVAGRGEDLDEETSNGTILRTLAFATFAVAAIVMIIGGYVLKWKWTGFDANKQLWDWIGLLLLPVAFGAFPLWLKFSGYMSPARRRLLGSVVVVVIAFVLVGYLDPLAWTGFQGQTLWNWLTLIILPLSLMTIRLWPESGRDVRRGHLVLAAVVVAGLIVTVIGGYAANWAWTGYQGNTLWDWLQLLLAPVAVSTCVVPTLINLVSGRVEEGAAADEERKRRDLALTTARERVRAA